MTATLPLAAATAVQVRTAGLFLTMKTSSGGFRKTGASGVCSRGGAAPALPTAGQGQQAAVSKVTSVITLKEARQQIMKH